MDEESAAYQRTADHYRRLAEARSNIYGHEDNLIEAQGRRANTLLGAMPLGAEQRYVQKQNLLRTGLDTTNAPTSAAYGGIRNPLAGLNLTPYGDLATATALGERRKALANVDPNFQFGAMGAYGLGETTAAEQEVAEYARARAGERMAREATMAKSLEMQLADAKMFYDQDKLLNQQRGDIAPAPVEQKKPWWKKALKIASVAAPFALAPFTGGLSLAAQAAIGGGAGILGGLASGKRSVKDLILAGGMGAIPIAGAGGALRGGSESVKAAVLRGLVNPQALASMGAATIGGPTGDALQMGARLLPGIQAYNQPPTGPFLGDPTGRFGPGAPTSAALAQNIKFPAIDSPFLPPQPGRTAPWFGTPQPGMPVPTASGISAGIPSSPNPFRETQLAGFSNVNRQPFTFPNVNFGEPPFSGSTRLPLAPPPDEGPSSAFRTGISMTPQEQSLVNQSQLQPGRPRMNLPASQPGINRDIDWNEFMGDYSGEHYGFGPRGVTGPRERNYPNEFMGDYSGKYYGFGPGGAFAPDVVKAFAEMSATEQQEYLYNRAVNGLPLNPAQQQQLMEVSKMSPLYESRFGTPNW